MSERKYTKTPPTKPGWYWVRFTGTKHGWVAGICKRATKRGVIDIADVHPSIRFHECEFAGPIPEPEEAE